MVIQLSCGCRFDGPHKKYDVQYTEEVCDAIYGYSRATVLAVWCEKCVKELGPKMDDFLSEQTEA